MARLTSKQWIEAEELYRHGWTQKQISEKFGVRVEAVSIHMRNKNVKSGEREEAVRDEVRKQVDSRIREFTEKKAMRQIETKESFYTLVRTLVSMFVKDVKTAQDNGHGIALAGGAAKALREALAGVKMAREELYTILNVAEIDDLEDDLPSLGVSTLTEVEEQILRSRRGGSFDDDDDGLAESIAMAENAFEDEDEMDAEVMDDLLPSEDDDIVHDTDEKEDE